MKILILLSHPAQFHFYKNTIKKLREKKHKIFILIKTKDVLSMLLEENGFDFYNILPFDRKNSKLSIIFSLLKRDLKLFIFSLGKNIDLFMGTDASLAHVAFILRKPCITTLEDDYDIIKNLANITYPLTSTILVPNVCDVGKWNNKKVAYDGYMKLAYLHPKYFSCNVNKIPPCKQVPFSLIRLSKLMAHHDTNIKGISENVLEKVIEKLKRKGNVFISSEKKLPQKFNQYILEIPASDIHDYLSYSQILICDSQSMAVEAAMLGTPSIRFSDFAGKISVLEELEHKYHLTFGIHTSESEKLLFKIDELFTIENLREEFQIRRKKMLSDKINVTDFLVWFVENYPQSFQIMKENSDYQYNFR